MSQFDVLKPHLTWDIVLSRRGAVGGAALAAMFLVGLFWGSWTRACAGERCPSIARLTQGKGPQQTSKIYAADGRLITELGLERRTVLPLREIPLWVRQAFLATEDKRFYQHHGIDYWRILGSVKANISSLSYTQGFSTITMQLARNIFPDLGREKKLTRKFKEARVALEIEHNFAKDTILQMYLNQIDLGAGSHGVEAAAQIYFGKSARNLNVAEAATLAAIPKAPSFYNPRLHPDRAVRRRNVVLALMQDQGFLSPEEAEQWRAYPLVLTTSRTNYGDVAPYFVEWLRTQFLEPRYGRDLYERGLRIYTTLDLDMQEAAERALSAQLDAIEAGVYTNGKWDGRSTYREYLESSKAGEEQDRGGYTPYLQGALLSIDARTGAILAMIGGRDFADSKFNRITQAVRQPGSTFKPFVYSAAVRAGHPVTEILDDTPLDHPVMQPDSSLWQPQDYDLTTMGQIPMRQSLYLSRNLSTIKLGMALGEQTVIGEARRYGLTTPIPPVPAIHIGARGVYPIELIAAFTAFATLGTRAQPFGIIRVEDKDGNILWQPTVQREEVLDPAHAWLMTDMLRDVVRRGTAAGAVQGAGFSYPSAGKTGTTDDYTDAWYIGFTSQIVTGIWLGYDIVQRIMNNAAGGRIVAPAWTEFMRDVYDRRPAPPDWPRPDSLVPREVDWKTGYLATPFCPQADRHWDWFYPGTEPRQLCPVHGGLGPVIQ
jgi:penicillin-binding protein 1A